MEDGGAVAKVCRGCAWCRTQMSSLPRLWDLEAHYEHHQLIVLFPAFVSATPLRLCRRIRCQTTCTPFLSKSRAPSHVHAFACIVFCPPNLAVYYLLVALLQSAQRRSERIDVSPCQKTCHGGYKLLCGVVLVPETPPRLRLSQHPNLTHRHINAMSRCPAQNP